MVVYTNKDKYVYASKYKTTNIKMIFFRQRRKERKKPSALVSGPKCQSLTNSFHFENSHSDYHYFFIHLFIFYQHMWSLFSYLINFTKFSCSPHPWPQCFSPKTEEQLKSRSSGSSLGGGRRKLANERLELDLLSTRYKMKVYVIV